MKKKPSCVKCGKRLDLKYDGCMAMGMAVYGSNYYYACISCWNKWLEHLETLEFKYGSLYWQKNWKQIFEVWCGMDKEQVVFT